MSIPTGPATEGATHPGYVVVAGRWVRAPITGSGSGPSADALATLTDRVSDLENRPTPSAVLPPRPAPAGMDRLGSDNEISDVYAALMNDALPTAEDAANRRWIRVTDLPADADGRTDEWWLARSTTSGLTWEQEGVFAGAALPPDQYIVVRGPVAGYTTTQEDFGGYIRATGDVTAFEPVSGFLGRRVDIANVGGSRIDVVPGSGVTFSGPTGIEPGHAVSLVVTGPGSYDVRGGVA